jgi:hypothetical protein
MTKTELKKKMLAILATKITPLGFSFKKSQECFMKKTEWGWYEYQIISYSFSYGYEIRTTMSIRYHQVEDIYHQVSSFEPKYQKKTSTIGCSISELKKSNTYHYDLNEEEDIEKVVYSLEKEFTEIVLPYFESNSNLIAIDKLINTNIEENNVNCHMRFKCFSGLIVAKLIQNPNYENLKSTYSKQIKLVDSGFHVENYNKLLILLETL